MTVIYALKILALSISQSYKEYFFEHNEQVTGFSSNYKSTVGVNIYASTVLVNNYGEMVSLSIWDVDSNITNELMGPFYKGATGTLLFCSLDDLLNIDELNSIISDLRQVAGEIPIFLIIDKKDGMDYSIDMIESFIEENSLKKYYFLPDANDILLGEISRSIIYNEYDTSYGELNQWIKKKERDFQNFKTYFNKCPCCNEPLHVSYLRTFFFSQDTKKQQLKEKLSQLIENSSRFNFHIGIPCCTCFKKYFDE